MLNNNIEHDDNRTLFLEKKGYTVLRFWNNIVFEEIEGVLNKIFSVLDSV